MTGNKAELVVMGVIDMRKDNEKDILDIPEKYLKGVSFHYVEDVADVWEFALTDEKVEHPINFTIPDNDKKEEK